MTTKGKIYNSDLLILDQQELDCCPPDVTVAFNIMVYDPTLRERINLLLIILRVLLLVLGFQHDAANLDTTVGATEAFPV